MLNVLEDVIYRHRQSGIVVDTNLLLVFFLARWNKSVALRFKRTQGYTENDCVLLGLVLSQFDKWIVTPAILAEVSNLAGNLPEAQRDEFFVFLKGLLPEPPLYERCIELSQVAAAPCFVRLGFTDATIEQLGASGAPILTDDLPLYDYLQRRSIEAFNFNHIRYLAG